MCIRDSAREAAEFVETVAAPALIAAVAIFAIILLSSCFCIARRFFMSMETAETPFRTAGRGSLIGLSLIHIWKQKTENSLAPPLLPTDSAFSKYTSRLLQKN